MNEYRWGDRRVEVRLPVSVAEAEQAVNFMNRHPHYKDLATRTLGETDRIVITQSDEGIKHALAVNASNEVFEMAVARSTESTVKDVLVDLAVNLFDKLKRFTDAGIKILRERVTQVRCREHAQRAGLGPTTTVGDILRLQFPCCCDGLKQQIVQALRG
jgi:hypothetical protein